MYNIPLARVDTVALSLTTLKMQPAYLVKLWVLNLHGLRFQTFLALTKTFFFKLNLC